MANLKIKDIWYRIGSQADRTTVAASLLDFVPPADAVDLNVDFASEDLDTEHGNPGILYTVPTGKNLEKKRVGTFLCPTYPGTFLNGCVSRNASSGELTYYTIERWWGSALAGSEDKGERFYGFLMDTFSLTIDRGGTAAPLMLEIDGFQNKGARILNAETAPTKDFSKAVPYLSTGALIDFVPDTSAGSFGADDQDVRRVSISYSNNLSVEGLMDNASDLDLDKVWTVQAPGEQRCSVEVEVRVTADEYLRLDKSQNPVIGALRMALTHPKGTTVSSSGASQTITAGDQNDQTVTVTATTGILVGDVLCIKHPTTGFTTLIVKTVNAGVSLVFDTDTGGGTGKDSRVTINGAVGGPLTLQNMAVGIIIDSMTYKGRNPPSRQGNFRTVTLRYEAKLAAAATRIIEVHAYDHLNSRIS